MYQKITHWCIKRTPETADNINEWFSSLGKRRLTAKTDFHQGWGRAKSFWSYLHYPEHKGKFLHNGKIKGYKEITFDEFTNHILTKKICLLKEKSGYRNYILRPKEEKNEQKTTRR